MARPEDVDRAADEWATDYSYSRSRYDLAREAYKAGYERCEHEMSPERVADDPA